MSDNTPASMTPEEARAFQRWKGMDGAVAWHLIDRHAEGWADTGLMMNAWLEANRASQPEPAQVSALDALTAEQERLGLYEQPFERIAREALELIAAPMRGDGTWNRDREACRALAADALGLYEKAEPAAPADCRQASAWPILSMFASGVANRKWQSLQIDDGYRMTNIWFANADRRGEIDAWGNVRWLPAGPSVAPEPIAWCVTGCSTLKTEDEARAEARMIGGDAQAIPLYAHPPRAPLTEGQERAEFEKVVSGPPYEKEIDRFPDNGTSAWPGNYKNYSVDLAWAVWRERARIAAFEAHSIRAGGKA